MHSASKMSHWIKVLILSATVFAKITVHATKLSAKEYHRFTNSGPKQGRAELSKRGEGNPYMYVNCVNLYDRIHCELC